MASALEARLPHARWTEPEGGFFIGVYLPPEVGVRQSDVRGFFPEKDGSAFLWLPFCAVSVEQIREGVERLASVLGVSIL